MKAHDIHSRFAGNSLPKLCSDSAAAYLLDGIVARFVRLSVMAFYRSIWDDLIYNHLSFDGGPVKRRAALDVGGWAKDG